MSTLYCGDNCNHTGPHRYPPEPHEHDFRLILGPDGHGQLYGNYEGYVHRCPCGDYAPDVKAWIKRDYAKRLKAARALVAEADATPAP